MTRQYSFSPQPQRPALDATRAVLAVDTGSPLVSVALAIDRELVAEESAEARHSSSRLLEMVEDCLHRARVETGQLDLLIGLRGPGSFTGLRVGLATLLGMKLALDIPTATVTTFRVLASLAEPQAERGLACVDALRGAWLVQEFAAGASHAPTGEPRLASIQDLTALRPTCLVGFGVSRLRGPLGLDSGTTFIEPGPLAPSAIRLLETPDSLDWRVESLSHPLYLSPPAVRPPPSAR